MSRNGNEDQGQLVIANESEIGAVVDVDTDSDVMAKDSVEREIEEEQSDTFSSNEADTKPSDAPKKPKMYFDWLDDKTLVKIFGESGSFDRKTTPD